jgi:hypothetical protein
MNPQEDPMTTDLLLPEVHMSLARAVAHRTAPGVPVHRRDRRRRPILLSRRAGLIAIIAALATGTAIAATAPWSPIVGSDAHGHPTTTAAAVPPDELAALSVLRRPQTDADRSPRVDAMLTVLSPNVNDGVHLDGIRVLDTPANAIAVLVPIDRDVANAPGYGGPAQATANVLCLFYGTPPTVGGVPDTSATAYGQKCGTVADLEAGRIFMGGQSAGRLTLTGLVPDGIAKVGVPLRTGETITAPVTSNSFHIDTAVTNGAYEDASIRWYAPDGTRIR